MKFKKQIALAAAVTVISSAFLAGCGENKKQTTPAESQSPTASVKSASDMKWWQKTVVYEAYPNSFKDTDGDGYGDLKGLTSELDHLKELGVGAVWITPFFESPMKDNGYDVADYRKVNPRYGTDEDLDNLFSEANKRGIKLVLDLVTNHTSEECEWFKESRSGKDNDKSDYYIWADPAEDGSAPNNWRSIFGGSAWTYDETRKQYYLHTFGDFQPDLNWANPKVRQEIYDVANYWADKGAGGFRLDAIPYIKKPAEMKNGEPDQEDGTVSIHTMTVNTDGILDYLHEFKDKVSKGRDIFTVGEANGVPASELNKWVGDNGVFDMIFSFDHENVQFTGGEVWSATKDWKLTELKKTFTDSQNAIKDSGWYPMYLENHDQPRSINHFLPEGADPVLGGKALATLLMTMRGTPFMYEGEEIGMTNVDWDNIDDYNDISSKNQYQVALDKGLSREEAIKCVQKYSRDNARTSMQWNTSENAGFTTGTPWLKTNSNYKTVNVETEKSDPDSVLNFYMRLKSLRANNSVFIDGSYEEKLADSEEIFSYVRANSKDKVQVLINFTGSEVSYDTSEIDMDAAPLISNYSETEVGKLKPYEAVVVELKH